MSEPCARERRKINDRQPDWTNKTRKCLDFFLKCNFGATSSARLELTHSQAERERESQEEKKKGVYLYVYIINGIFSAKTFFWNTHKDTKTTSDAFICVEMSNRISNGYMCQIPSVCVCVRGKRETGPKRDGE